MKKSLFACCFLLSFLTAFLTAQTPPVFNGTISKSNLEAYLSRSAFFDNVNEGCYYVSNSPCYEVPDKSMLINIKPFFLGRVATSWGGTGWASFTEEIEIAQKIHTQVGTGIILEAFLSEFIDKSIAPPQTGNVNITIPDSVKLAFNYTGSAQYFDYREMKYDDVVLSNPCAAPGAHRWCTGSTLDGITPDMTKVMSKMYYYYVMTKLIDYGYEAFTIGQWDLLNDVDSGNAALWEVFSKVRVYGNAHARRNLILITGACDASNLLRGTDVSTNNLPYLNYNSGSNNNRLLFDFMENTASWIEDGYVANGLSPFYKYPNDSRYERLIKLPSNFSIFQFGGEIAQTNWGWNAADKLTIPHVFHLDVGGPNLASEEGNLNYNDQSYANGYRTWGWGGELNYYMYTTLPYRRHLLHTVAHQIHERSPNGYLMMPLRAPVSSNYFKFSVPYVWAPYSYNYSYQAPGEIGFKFRGNDNTTACSIAFNSSELWCYPAEIAFQIETQIKEIWNKSLEVTFCTPSTFTGDFTETQGFNSPDFPRFLMDVDGDGDKDIVGISSTNIRVSKYTSGAFQPSTIWSTGVLTTGAGWNTTSFTRTTGDFNGDGKQDIIGMGPGGVWVGISNGTNAFTFTNWSTDFANTNNTTDEWANSKSVRVVADVNHDGKDDIVGFGNAATYRALSTGTAFGAKAQWHWDYCNNNGYNNAQHIRMVADVDGDGDSDIVAFGAGAVYASINNGGVISSTITLLADMCSNQGWSMTHVRCLADIDGDGDLDIIGFGNEGVLVSKNTSWSCATPEYWTYQFGNSTRAGNWSFNQHVRMMADVNGDGKSDVVAFGENGMDVVLSTGTYFSHIFHYNDFGNLTTYGGWDNFKHLRRAINFDTDARNEIICFGQTKVFFMNNCNGGFFLPAGDVNNTDADPVTPTEFSISPNPGRDLIEVNVDQKSPFTHVAICDQLGRVLVRYERNDDKAYAFTLDVSRLHTGLYIVTVNQNNRVLNSKKFLKIE